MIGSIIGDLAGSIYEFDQFKNLRPVKVNNIIEETSFISDDSILTVAVADAILSGGCYEQKLRKYGIRYGDMLPDFKPYFPSPFSRSFTKWVRGEGEGKSFGNGAMMRISPVGFLFDSEKQVEENAMLATIPSHNSEEAVRCATIIAKVIFFARQGKTKEEIKERLGLEIKKPKLKKPNYACHETIDVCLYSVFESNSFEEAIRTAVGFGGDTDTNACIVGGMAEAFWGVPDYLKKQALQKLPEEFVEIVEKFYAKLEQKAKI